MKLLILLLIVYHTQAKAVETECKGVILHNITYEKEILLHINNSPYQFAIDHDTNTLFFSFTSQNPDVSVLFESGFLNLKTHEFHTIDRISNGFASTVDSNAHTVYLGGDDGIYTFNYDTKLPNRLEGTNHSIWQLFYKNNLYYTTYPGEMAYIFKDGKSERIPELLDTKALLIFIDNNNNIYFANKTGLYVHEKEKNEVSYLGDYNVECFAADTKGNLYFGTNKALYQIHDNKIERLASLKPVIGLAIENDGSFVVGLHKNIVRLKPTTKQCIVPKKPEKKN